MVGPSFVLCALVPPGSIEAEVGRVQAALFSDHGLVSAQAVPPLVPIAFLDPKRRCKGVLSRLNGSVAAGWRARLGDAEWVDGHLFARMQSSGAWTVLRAAAISECGPEASLLFPVAEGFYLGCADAPPEARAGILPRIEPRSFSSSTLVLMELQTGQPGPTWWNELHWEIADERPLRGRRQA